MRNRRGFTLIELLVVIAIIAILAAILFPVFTKAKQKTWQTTCCNHALQVGKAFRMYCDDWNGFLPNCGEGAAPGIARPGWCQMAYALKRYISGDAAKQFICPADTGDKCIGGSSQPYNSFVWYSSWAWPSGWGPGWVNGCKMEDCRINVSGLRPAVWQFTEPPSKRPIVFDHRPWHWSTTGTGWTNIAGKNSVLWADGHASMSTHNIMLAFMGTGPLMPGPPPGF
jgi:prepilin-type N-terminal cleavage/methylation domain-containing protein/prepilin-type processing-associated H-X9-DG protein